MRKSFVHLSAPCLLSALLLSASLFLFASLPLFLSPLLHNAPPTFLHPSPPSFSYYHRFLQVPQIVWGLNNQKIALARAALTARFLNRTLLMPLLSASLFYKEAELLQPLPFEHLFSLERFNRLCNGFVAVARLADLPQGTLPFNVTKGSGRRWTVERDLEQLRDCRKPEIEKQTLLRFVGKHPFLWHDHWPVKDYAKVFECLVLVENLSAEVDRVVSKLRQASHKLSDTRHSVSSRQSKLKNEAWHQTQNDLLGSSDPFSREPMAEKTSKERLIPSSFDLHPYIAVHMRIEKDWMIHCKKTEDRARSRGGVVLNICSTKEDIIERVSHIPNFSRPSLVYLAVADVLLEDTKLLDGWKDGLVPVEKKRLGVLELYRKYPYLIQSAIDYEVCLRSDIFVGNSFSTFSSLIVLERTMKLLRTGTLDACGTKLPSYAYNLPHRDGSGPQPWITNLSHTSLQAISYGSNHVSCVFGV